MEVRFMTAKTQALTLVARSRSNPTSLFHHHIWPVAWVSAGVIATVAWSGFLGYALFRLVF